MGFPTSYYNEINPALLCLRHFLLNIDTLHHKSIKVR